MNTFGHIFRLTSFGESHGPAIGGVIDGMPAGIDFDSELLQNEMARRRPGQSLLTTARKEDDQVEILSGIFEGKTTGCPIGFIVRNTSQHSSDYDNLRELFRPSHADYTYQTKYGIRDHRGGGRSSARETITRCVAGAFAKMALRQLNITVLAYTSQVGNIKVEKNYSELDLTLIETNAVRCPDPIKAAEMAQLIAQVKAQGDTVGGTISAVIKGCPAGLGDPVFGRLQSRLGAAMMSINAVKGFEYGLGFAGCDGRGSQQNDIFVPNTTRNDTISQNSNQNAESCHDFAINSNGDTGSNPHFAINSNESIENNLNFATNSNDSIQIASGFATNSNQNAHSNLHFATNNSQSSHNYCQVSQNYNQASQNYCQNGHNDTYIAQNCQNNNQALITTLTNNSGGIQGGISNGQDIYFRVAFKPVATILQPQRTVDLNGNAIEFKARGRHDSCVLPRAVPVVEAMAAIVILDSYLANKTTHL